LSTDCGAHRVVPAVILTGAVDALLAVSRRQHIDVRTCVGRRCLPNGLRAPRIVRPTDRPTRHRPNQQYIIDVVVRFLAPPAEHSAPGHLAACVLFVDRCVARNVPRSFEFCYFLITRPLIGLYSPRCLHGKYDAIILYKHEAIRQCV